MSVFRVLVGLCLAVHGLAAALRGSPASLMKSQQELLGEDGQDLVTWDEHSLFVKGERILFYSGEFHPFRLPVPGLWLDVFQKIRSLGYNGVSFYTSWNVHEGKPGVFRADGIFGYDDFFDAASKAGIYLLARPGPYINAEISGGGFPGWITRVDGRLRTSDPGYLNATNLYAKNIGEIIAKAQITTGGPVILLQPENEYTQGGTVAEFPDGNYFHYVQQQFRDAGVVVPLISNDAAPDGYFAKDKGLGGLGQGLDIYGYDSYPLGFNCGDPYTWGDGKLETTFASLHQQQAPDTPNSIIEYQGGSFDPWGGFGFDRCEILLSDQFERVFYKNDFSFGLTIFNIYMTYGGTNWGNLGHPKGYTSYDYAAVIDETRQVHREKYSQAKLIANFFQASPSYLVATPGNLTNATYTNTSALTVTPLFANETGYFILRHSQYNTMDSTSYNLTLPTSQGNVTVPQLGGSLTLNGRDSKVHVANYDVGAETLLYSTAEIFTWKSSPSRTVLVVFGGPGELHELAFTGKPKATQVDGPSVKIDTVKQATVLNWQVSADRSLVQVGDSLFVYIVDRNTAYNFWTLPAGDSDVVVEAGYLVRNATVSGDSMSLVGDVNATTSVEIVFGAPKQLKTLQFNGQEVQFKQDDKGAVTAQVEYKKPSYSLPSLESLDWKYVDSLPELQASYDDSAWKAADITKTPNIANNLTTPTSLYASDYGFNIGTIIFRGHFTAQGNESNFSVVTQGGQGYGHSLWLNDSFLGSWQGIGAENDFSNFSRSYGLGKVDKGKPYVLTVVVDNMGLDENYNAGDSGTKNPRGILDYSLSGRDKSAISWKLTGNLGGEDYKDISRGPLNEGGMYAERQGFHLPKAPTSGWKSSKPTDGIDKAGIGYYYASFDLDMPQGYDIPLSIVFANTTTTATATVSQYRAQLFVNGYQFGKYVHHIGPQDAYPVPEGILNHRGKNYVGLTLWAQDAQGAKFEGVKLQAGLEVQSGYGQIRAAPQEAYKKRLDAY